MNRRGTIATLALALALAAATGPLAPLRAGELRFAVPEGLGEIAGSVGLAAGDFDGDGALDLAVLGHSGEVEILRREPGDRDRWEASRLRVGTGTFMIAAADLDEDGLDDLIAADPGSSAWVVPSAGPAFGQPVVVPGTEASRWIAVGDWDRDGDLDLASASQARDELSILLGDGRRGLRIADRIPIGGPHAVEAFDHDGDRDLDLAVGHGDEGLRILSGRGDGRFSVVGEASGLPPCARLVATGDFDDDGRGDLALSCRRAVDGETIAQVVIGLSNGDGTFRSALELTSEEVTPLAVSDLDGDGRRDLATVSAAEGVVSVRLGAGAGTFRPESRFGPAGGQPSALLAIDLDGDGRRDLVAADAGVPGARLLRGRAGDRLFEAGLPIQNRGASAAGVADVDGDGAAEILVPGSSPPRIDVLRGIPSAGSSSVRATVELDAPPAQVLAADLDGDGTPDVVASSAVAGRVEAIYLEATGRVRRRASGPAGLPTAIAAARLAQESGATVAVLRVATSDVAVLRDRGSAELEALEPVETLEGARLLRAGDVDGDGAADLVVAGAGKVAFHRGRGDGSVEAARIVHEEAIRTYVDLALGDLSGDGRLDIALAAPAAGEVLLLEGADGASFAAVEPIRVAGVPRSVGLSDLDGDGRLDASVAMGDGTVAWFPSSGGRWPVSQYEVRTGVPQVADHVVVDLSGDEIPDLAVFGFEATWIFEGLPSSGGPTSFRRGDADSSGSVDVTDAVAVLEHLFRGGERPCEDGSDADDDGRLSLTDAVVILRWLFQGGPPPGPPGPEACGEDPTPDGLAGCEEPCRPGDIRRPDGG